MMTQRDTRIYLERAYASMQYRCDNYNNYKKIKVCKEWRKNKIAFFQWAMSHGFRPGYSVHRIEHDWPYDPYACVILTKKEHTQLHILMRQHPDLPGLWMLVEAIPRYRQRIATEIDIICRTSTTTTKSMSNPIITTT
jgi:hypothetical protein